ncbi:hypothetical protein DCS_05059 [Drechmeria coniospora]|uniref:Oligosaccharyl transferase subunit n=1 Tax=Drechmeria coniospora TaxID=98403 RepID=A0A151GLS0_DRECN|nr:hypothetical protein DCS_05059 [Drechmeria coniospora]KYK58046.1 hypothetical protein DCS_05059 [Drechmeria coniospora]ODA83118.1 hypothetical protein RJ55_01627 [Drechmeria coniospora]
MRFLHTLASACTIVAGFVASASAAKSSEQRYDEFRRLSKISSTISLNEESYKELTKRPRDYTVAVLLTALESRLACQVCREFQPEWDLIGRNWVNGDSKDEARTLFATLDFAEGRNVFIDHGLQTAPVLFLYPPTVGPHAAASADPLRYDFVSGPPTAEDVNDWIIKNLPGRRHVLIRRPINYARWASGVTLVVGVCTLAATLGPYVLPIVQNRNVWAAGTMVAILLFISGHMFNHIRKVPYVSGNGQGGVTYIVNNFSNQLGLETQIVAAIYGILAFTTIALVFRVPRMTEPRSQLIAALLWVGVMFIFNSFLMSVFRMKYSGYPFSLPPFM